MEMKIISDIHSTMQRSSNITESYKYIAKNFAKGLGIPESE